VDTPYKYKMKGPKDKDTIQRSTQVKDTPQNTKMERLKSWEMKKKRKKVQDGRTQVLANEGHSKEGGGPLRGGEQIKRRFGYGGNGDI
jgi:hypothetical protein